MRHAKGNRKLNRPTDQRIALLRSLALALFTHKKIQTTDVRAKELRSFAEKLITLGKKGDLHSRRTALKYLPNSDAVKELFGTIAPSFVAREGGYIRLTKLGFRRGDAAPVSLVELISA